NNILTHNELYIIDQWNNDLAKTNLVNTHSEGGVYELDEKFTAGATIEYDQEKALEDADFIYVKSWSSYRDYGKINCTDPSWMMTADKLENTHQAKVMHCLPVRRNLVIGDNILDGNSSLVVEEAGNRVWAAQAVLAEILKNI